MRKHARLQTLILLLTILASGIARGEDSKATARREAVEATRSYDLSEFQTALEHFKAAYRAVPDPVFLFNIGQCQRQLKQRDEAIKSYRSYLRNAGNVANRAEVEQIVATLEHEAEAEAEAKRDAAARAQAAAARAEEERKAMAQRQAQQRNKDLAMSLAESKRMKDRRAGKALVGVGVTAIGLGTIGLAFSVENKLGTTQINSGPFAAGIVFMVPGIAMTAAGAVFWSRANKPAPTQTAYFDLRDGAVHF